MIAVIVWVLLCIAFPPLIPFVIVGGVICLCFKPNKKEKL